MTRWNSRDMADPGARARSTYQRNNCLKEVRSKLFLLADSVHHRSWHFAKKHILQRPGPFQISECSGSVYRYCGLYARCSACCSQCCKQLNTLFWILWISDWLVSLHRRLLLRRALWLVVLQLLGETVWLFRRNPIWR